MEHTQFRLAGVELYFEDLKRAQQFYSDTLGLQLEEDRPPHHAKYGLTGGFLCLERKHAEPYPSADKAVVFIEVANLRALMAQIGAEHVVGSDVGSARPWAAVRDPEGHTVLVVQALDLAAHSG